MKTRFNLQPWRENVRKSQQKRFATVTALVVFGVVGVCGLNYYIENKYIEDQQSAQSVLRSQIDSLRFAKQKVEELQALIEEINKQITAIEDLQSQRGVALKLLDHIATTTPETVFLNDISFDGRRLVINGVAETDIGIVEFLRALQKSDLLGIPHVDVIRSAGSTGRYVIPENTEIKSFTVLVDLAV